jgi:hypothetical protein
VPILSGAWPATPSTTRPVDSCCDHVIREVDEMKYRSWKLQTQTTKIIPKYLWKRQKKNGPKKGTPPCLAAETPHCLTLLGHITLLQAVQNLPGIFQKKG